MADSAIPELPPLVGQAPAFREVLAQVSQLAPLDRPVLVVGERGTGKELIATRLALLSPRWDKPFHAVNCAALAETLLDSELFGHEAGAFTGATRRRPSRFELADGGTIFLDEIASASLAVQEKVLRVIEYGSFTRVGGNEVLSVDVRLIAATNVDLPALAEAQKFRSDLLDRLAFDVVTLPPLRARREDIPLLAEHFARAMTRVLGRGYFAGFSERAMSELMEHDWPGNVRELKNAVERSLYRAPDPAQPLERILLDPFASPWRPAASHAAAIPPHPALSPEGRGFAHGSTPSPHRGEGWGEGDGSFREKLRRYEAELLRAALAANGGNQSRAAAALGLGYHQFRRRLKALSPRSGA
ncbi:MAG TPA: phage shock protein operon transcriptional activator [Stellaceae bacterium]|nr:phage shock protein operon transcriptional activator [Stellaceae bacterium]